MRGINRPMSILYMPRTLRNHRRPPLSPSSESSPPSLTAEVLGTTR